MDIYRGMADVETWLKFARGGDLIPGEVLTTKIEA